MYYLIGYRKKVVHGNLKLAFPEKTEQEIVQIKKKFYRHLCDMFLEMIKTMGISTKEMQKRFVCTNIEVLNKLEQQGKSTILMLPHYASWEWVLSMNAQMTSKGYGIYQKIQNKYFDKLVRDIRSKFGTTLIRTNETRAIVATRSKEKEVFTLGIISDQSPMVSRAKYWSKFMGIEVPIHVGGEELSKKHNLIPLYLKVSKVGRGYYKAELKCLSENPQKVPDYEITDAFLRETEESIKKAPEYYFWTHKRWKHRNKKPTD